jgi:hypothetical protein
MNRFLLIQINNLKRRVTSWEQGAAQEVTKYTLFSRRLRSSDTGLWLQLPEESRDQLSSVERAKLVKDSSSIENTIFYAASVDNTDVGGAAIYRDHTRLGVALLSLRLRPQLREAAAPHLIRSSLPFFRSVSIRQIDAILNRTIPNSLPFPLNLELESWSQKALRSLRFEETGLLDSYSWSDVEIPPTEIKIAWGNQSDLDTAQRSMWQERKQTGLNCSQVFFSLELAQTRGTLRTGHASDGSLITCTLEQFDDIIVISSITSSVSIEPYEVAAGILSLIKPGTYGKLIISLMGKGQNLIAAAFDDILHQKSKRRELQLLQRLL